VDAALAHATEAEGAHDPPLALGAADEAPAQRDLDPARR
jgi:hypothetical protein